MKKAEDNFKKSVAYRIFHKPGLRKWNKTLYNKIQNWIAIAGFINILALVSSVFYYCIFSKPNTEGSDVFLMIHLLIPLISLYIILKSKGVVSCTMERISPKIKLPAIYNTQKPELGIAITFPFFVMIPSIEHLRIEDNYWGLFLCPFY